MNAFDDFYRGKTVLVTGHTGFKGSWLSIWLHHLGAKVVGYALNPPTEPSNFVTTSLAGRIVDIRGDVRDFEKLSRTLTEHRPQIVFHLAAQPLVRMSYLDPRHTFDVNMLGTVNLLDAALRSESVEAVVSITSDKCYLNVDQTRGYAETDTLGGHDPYSASKACAELAIAVYQNARFQSATAGRDLAIASARAGNVIGGGDWARDRIVPDAVRAVFSGENLVLRSPDATRPWQHVLEPLGGYMWLGSRLSTDSALRTSWNFGPDQRQIFTVADVVTRLLNRFAPHQTQMVINRDKSGTEARLLQLDCTKAREQLNWMATQGLDGTLDAIVEWYQAAHRADQDMFALAVTQIDKYTRSAFERGLRWATPSGR